ncbi:hypothetical protein EV685_1146 [Sphaerotilus mobilis]|uniref:Uncharacterized protein n=1 Tax=Sphaerotilus mobilis TaxID=47994 RepID=A0A4Q7LRA6_9BURK|nr:hypothetical protein EV685_1146 [Sphaerotilus mobilis]
MQGRNAEEILKPLRLVASAGQLADIVSPGSDVMRMVSTQ